MLLFFFILYFRREFGLERFVPMSLIESMKRKELRRLIGHFLKLNQQMTGSSKMLTQLQVRHKRPFYHPSYFFYFTIFWCRTFLAELLHSFAVEGLIVIKFIDFCENCLACQLCNNADFAYVQLYGLQWWTYLAFETLHKIHQWSRQYWLLAHFFPVKLCSRNLSDIASSIMSSRFMKSLLAET